MDRIWGFGPRTNGANVLINRVPDLQVTTREMISDMRNHSLCVRAGSQGRQPYVRVPSACQVRERLQALGMTDGDAASGAAEPSFQGSPEDPKRANDGKEDSCGGYTAGEAWATWLLRART